MAAEVGEEGEGGCAGGGGRFFGEEGEVEEESQISEEEGVVDHREGRAAAELAVAALAGGSGSASAIAAEPLSAAPAGHSGGSCGQPFPMGPKPSYVVRELDTSPTTEARLADEDQASGRLGMLDCAEGGNLPELPEEVAREVAAEIEGGGRLRLRGGPSLDGEGLPRAGSGGLGAPLRRDDPGGQAHLARSTGKRTTPARRGPVKRHRTGGPGYALLEPEAVAAGGVFPELPEQEARKVLAELEGGGKGVAGLTRHSMRSRKRRPSSVSQASVKRQRTQAMPQLERGGPSKRQRDVEMVDERSSEEDPFGHVAADLARQPALQRLRRVDAEGLTAQAESSLGTPTALRGEAAPRPAHGRRYSGLLGDPVDSRDSRGHLLFISGAMIWCGTCGRYATKRLGRALRAPCPGEATGAYLTRLTRLRQGLHPLTGSRLVA